MIYETFLTTIHSLVQEKLEGRLKYPFGVS